IPEYGLTVNTVGQGTVVRSPDLVEYPEGTLVTLTAVPAEGWRLVGWTGDLTGTEAELAFAINAATSVTATFEEEFFATPVSDDFLGGALNSSLWTFVNPRNDATVSVVDGALRIAVPGGGQGHDVWTGGNFAPRVMQPVADGDFEMSARFLSNVTKKYQMQGFIVEASPGNYLRLDIYYTGTQVRVFAASFVNDTPTTRVNQAIPANPAGYFLRVVRAGKQ